MARTDILPDDLPTPPMPRERYACVAIDLPLHFQNRSAPKDIGSNRGPQRHYPTMSVEACGRIPMRAVLERDAFVFVWMWWPHIIAGTHLKLARAWRLKLSACVFTWVKVKRKTDMGIFERGPLLHRDLQHGTGYTTKKNTEVVILMRRGSPKRLNVVDEVIIAPVQEHSRKPLEFFRRAELYCAGPRLNMFAGADIPGWDSWGDQHREIDRSAAA